MDPAGLAARWEAVRRGSDTAGALAFFDSLPPVAVADLLGSWWGEEVPTGHPYDGLLAALRWHGKRFDAPDAVHPLIFDGPRGRRFAVNPAYLPLHLLTHPPAWLRTQAAARGARAALPALATRRPRARLRMVAHRGVVTAAMTYDALPINDVFRTIDADTVLGVMELRGLDAPYLFALHREPGGTAGP